MARNWRQRFLRPLGPRAAVVILAALATGCKTGSWGAKPSWWSFGGSAPAGSSLTAAPSFDADTTKPSSVAKPYPTTSTPEGYALDGGTKPAAAAAATAAMEPAAVTYGTTVAALAEQPEPSFQPTSPAAPAAVGPQVGPQVGPYASMQQPAAAAPPDASDPAAAAMAGFGAAPAFEAEPPPTAQAMAPAAGNRVADARGSAAWSAPPAAASLGGGDADSRYGQANGSRFGTGLAPAAQPAFEPNPSPDPATLLDPAPAMPAAPPARQPMQPTPPAASPLPGGMAPPARRPDPGYRPGGTSSYRPNRAILAGDESAVGPIQPIAYEVPAAAPQGLP